jgi:hypothetical protein
MADKDFARGERVKPQLYKNPVSDSEHLNSVMPLREGGLKSESPLNPTQSVRPKVSSQEPMTMPALPEYAKTPEGR